MPRIPNIRIRTRETADGRGRVYLDYRYKGRRRKETVGPNTSAVRRLAKQLKAKRELEIAEGTFFERKRLPKITFEEFAAIYARDHVAKLRGRRQVERHLRTLGEVFGDRLLSQIERAEVERYQTERLKRLAPATVNRELATMKTLFNKAIAWGYTTENPVKGDKLRKENNARVRYLEGDEAERLSRVCPPELWPIVVFARNTGLRRGELCELRWCDLDLINRIVTVREAKSGEGRKVPINDSALAVLERQPRGLKHDAVFLGPDGGPVKKDWVSHSFKRACRKAGVENLRFHDLRHDCGSRLAMAGVDLRTIQEILGHKTLAMTLRYAHLSPEHRLRAVRRLDEEVVPIAEPDAQDGRG